MSSFIKTISNQLTELAYIEMSRVYRRVRRSGEGGGGFQADCLVSAQSNRPNRWS